MFHIFYYYAPLCPSIIKGHVAAPPVRTGFQECSLVHNSVREPSAGQYGHHWNLA